MKAFLWANFIINGLTLLLTVVYGIVSDEKFNKHIWTVISTIAWGLWAAYLLFVP